MKRTISILRKRVALALMGMTALIAAQAASAVPILVANHSFEDPALAVNTNNNVAPPSWSGSGGVLNGFAAQGLDSRPDGSAQNLWSNGGDFFQVLGTAIAPNTTYTLTVDLGDRSDTGFPANTEIRLGSGGGYDTNLLPFTSEIRPLPTTGWQTWTATFDSGAAPVAGPLRIDLTNPGGVQPQFDNVRLDAAPTPAVDPFALRDVFVRNHTFEDNGTPGAPGFINATPVLWQLGAGGGGGVMSNLRPELIPRPDGTDNHAWSNGQDIFQVTGETIAADTLYTLSVDVGDRSDGCCGVPAGTEVRLGAGGVFGVDLLTPDSVLSPTPNGGWETWTISTFIEAGNPLIGQPLRVELFNAGGAQPQFDNVHITAQLRGGDAVPEPATATLAILGLGGLMMRRRRCVC